MSPRPRRQGQLDGCRDDIIFVYLTQGKQRWKNPSTHYLTWYPAAGSLTTGFLGFCSSPAEGSQNQGLPLPGLGQCGSGPFAWGLKSAEGPKGVALEGGMGEASMSSGLL